MINGKFTKDDCSVHVGGSVGEHYIELEIANALILQFRERLREQIIAELKRDGRCFYLTEAGGVPGNFIEADDMRTATHTAIIPRCMIEELK